MSPERPQVHHTGVHPEQAPARSEIDEIDSPLRGSHRHSIDDRTFYDDYDKSSKTEWRLRMHQFGCNVHGRDLPHEELGRRRWPTISTYLDRGQAGFSLGNRLLILIRRHRKDGTGPHMCDDQLSSDNVKIIMTRIATTLQEDGRFVPEQVGRATNRVGSLFPFDVEWSSGFLDGLLSDLRLIHLATIAHHITRPARLHGTLVCNNYECQIHTRRRLQFGTLYNEHNGKEARNLVDWRRVMSMLYIREPMGDADAEYIRGWLHDRSHTHDAREFHVRYHIFRMIDFFEHFEERQPRQSQQQEYDIVAIRGALGSVWYAIEDAEKGNEPRMALMPGFHNEQDRPSIFDVDVVYSPLFYYQHREPLPPNQTYHEFTMNSIFASLQQIEKLLIYRRRLAASQHTRGHAGPY